MREFFEAFNVKAWIGRILKKTILLNFEEALDFFGKFRVRAHKLSRFYYFHDEPLSIGYSFKARSRERLRRFG